MSAERFQIDMDELGCWARQSNETWACVMHFTKDSDILQVRIAEKVIRQQARDISELETDVSGLRSSEAAFKNDCDQLRADLAAAVAERDRLLAELPLSTGRDVNETRERLGPITRIADGPSERAYVCATTAREVVGYVIAERDAAKLRAEQAEARLAAIDGAPAVAMLCPLTESAFNESTIMTAYRKAKMPHVELIARPAKDQS